MCPVDNGRLSINVSIQYIRNIKDVSNFLTFLVLNFKKCQCLKTGLQLFLLQFTEFIPVLIPTCNNNQKDNQETLFIIPYEELKSSLNDKDNEVFTVNNLSSPLQQCYLF